MISTVDELNNIVIPTLILFIKIFLKIITYLKKLVT